MTADRDPWHIEHAEIDPPQPDSVGLDHRRSELARHSLALRSALRAYFGRHGVGPDEQDDLIQEIFLRIASGAALQSCDNLDAYITRTATSVLIDRHRRRRARHLDAHLEFDANLHAELVTPTDEVVIARQALRKTSLLLMELPERTRSVFVLNRMEGLPNREIATRLGLSLSSVEKEMARATRYLIANIGDAR